MYQDKIRSPNLIDSGKITDPETRQPNTQRNLVPNYLNVPLPNAPVLMINIGLIEEQVLNSFVDITPNPPSSELRSLNPEEQPVELTINVLDI